MKKILFISYYFKPDNGVAAQRISYWAENIKKHLENVEVDVITTTESDPKIESSIDNIFVVPDRNRGLLRRLFKTDKGASWLSDLRIFFSTSQKTYDTIIITGNPFLHFFIARDLKRMMNCKVILDFRDPFSKNERSVDNSLVLRAKRKILIILEYFFCEYADKIIVMNSHCAELLCSRRKDKVEIIDNGYDELNLERAKPISVFEDKSKPSLVYLGSFAADRDISNILVSNDNIGRAFNILHVGRSSANLKDDCRVKSVGLVPYSQAIGYAKGCDIGVILASGKGFESTTKIFDYIGISLPILIVTNGTPKTGNIYELVRHYPSVWWAENTIDSITETLTAISLSRRNLESPTFDRIQFSRSEGLKSLVSTICKLNVS
jgi:glycosyltransferase involved in cell wall biosynthesis